MDLDNARLQAALTAQKNRLCLVAEVIYTPNGCGYWSGMIPYDERIQEHWGAWNDPNKLDNANRASLREGKPVVIFVTLQKDMLVSLYDAQTTSVGDTSQKIISIPHEDPVNGSRLEGTFSLDDQ